MLSYDGETCTYDVMGCPTVYRGHSMTWGEYCRPLSYTLTNENTVTYTYDVGGRRIGKNNLRFVYSSDGALLAQSNGITFLYDTTGSAGFTFGEDTYLYRKNAQGDVIALLNTEGQVVATYVYDAWGNHRVFDAEGIDITNDSQYNNHVGNLNPIRYRSYYFDIETGLYWLSTRFYDPETGRFISQDEYTYLDPDSVNGLNLFAYCGNNPVMYVDPTGHFAISLTLIGLIVGAIIGATVGGIAAYNTAKNNGSEGWNLFGWTMLGIAGGGIVGGALGAGVGAIITKMTGIIGLSITKYSIIPIKSITVLGNMPGYISAATVTSSGYYLISDNLWNSMTEAQRWANNMQYLIDANKLGSQFALVPDWVVKAGSTFWEEIRFLIEQGISWTLF